MSNFVENLMHRPRQTKAASLSTQGTQKWSEGYLKDPKRNPKSAQGEDKEVEGHPEENNDAAMQRPASICPWQ